MSLEISGKTLAIVLAVLLSGCQIETTVQAAGLGDSQSGTNTIEDNGSSTDSGSSNDNNSSDSGSDSESGSESGSGNSTDTNTGGNTDSTGGNSDSTGGNTGNSDSSDNTTDQDTGSHVELLSPDVSETLHGTVTFKTSQQGNVWLYFGTTKGQKDIGELKMDSAEASFTFQLEAETKVYTRLWYLIDQDWTFVDYEFIYVPQGSGSENTDSENTGSDNTGEQNDSSLAGTTLRAPAAGTVLDGQVTFTTSAVGNIWLYFGSTRGANDIGELHMTSNDRTFDFSEVSVNNVHVRLWVLVDGNWQFTDRQFTVNNQQSSGNTDTDTGNNASSGSDDGVHHLVTGFEGRAAVDLVIVPDGFTADEMWKFEQQVESFKQKLFAYEELFPLYESAWNIHRLDIPSNQSGTDQPKSGISADTYFDSSFECSWVDRVICVDQSKVLLEVATYVPQYDQIIVLVNSSRHGGASVGNKILTSSSASGYEITMIHELGHGFANLDDEYTYGGSSTPTRESSSPNTTITNNAQTVKWAHWMGHGSGDSTIGMFEGGRYVQYGVWRPSFSSVMRNLGAPFHAVNLEAWLLATYREAGTYFDTLPASGTVTVTANSQQSFSITPTMNRGAQNFRWYLNGTLIANGTDQTSVTITAPVVGQSYQLSLHIEDATGAIRKDIQGYSSDVITWTLQSN